jgi:hypothetical protein
MVLSTRLREYTCSRALVTWRTRTSIWECRLAAARRAASRVTSRMNSCYGNTTPQGVSLCSVQRGPVCDRVRPEC